MESEKVRAAWIQTESTMSVNLAALMSGQTLCISAEGTHPEY